ncbi:MAG: hypothetical protein FWD53_00945 [Phycisphaerales bacterium]|nr:hypothetical protein [Phycisphaerales bacterium]
MNRQLTTIMSAIVIAVLLPLVACKHHALTTPPTPVVESQPVPATTQAAIDTENQYTISFDSRVMLVSDNFFDQLGFDWGPSLPQIDYPAILDNWTLNLLIRAVQADERSQIFDHPRMTVADGQEVRFSSRNIPEAPHALWYLMTMTPTISADYRYVVLQLRHLITNSKMETLKDTMSLPDGGTLCFNGGRVGKHLALFLVRPRIQQPTNPAMLPTAQAMTQAARMKALETIKNGLASGKGEVLYAFDIRDLLTVPKRPPFGETPEAAAAAQTPDMIAKAIIEVIETTVASHTWTSQGGKFGTIRELHGMLVINQTQENQTAIYNLLQQLRETRLPQIAVEIRLQLVDEATFEKLNLPKAKDGKAMTKTIDLEQLKELFNVIHDSKMTITVDIPKVTLRHGQHGYTWLTNQLTYFGRKGEVKRKDLVRPTPIYGMQDLDCGLVLNLHGRISADHKAVTLKVTPVLRELLKMEMWLSETPPDKFVIQRPVLHEAEMTATCNVQDGHVLVMGDMTIKRGLPQPRSFVGEIPMEPLDENSPSWRLVVLVRPRIVGQNGTELAK